MAATATSPSASPSGAEPLPFRWAGSWPFSEARPLAGTVTACTVAPLAISRAIVDEAPPGPGPFGPARGGRLAGNPGRGGDRPAAEHAHCFGLGAKLLDG